MTKLTRNLETVVKPEVPLRLCDALALCGRRIGVVGEDFEILTSLELKLQSSP